MSVLRETLPGGILRLTMDRPKAANALDRDLQESLMALLAEAGRDASVRAVLLAGAGGRVFSAGADLREILHEDPAEARVVRRNLLMGTLLAVLDCPRPVISVVRGKAVGGGGMLALLADELLMESGASISMPEIALGMASPIGVSVVAARGGRNAAHALLQAGEAMDAKAAIAAGLADAVHADDTLDEAAIARAEKLGAFDPDAFAANKAWMNAPLREALLRAAEAAGRTTMGAPANAT
ncbi:MAG: putative enoyl-CoA hydratase [Rubritepida sp.]|nr:putative enoyl-CoA hydratase [Rubritepida sp.]